MRRVVIECRTPNRPQQYRRGCNTGLQSIPWQRIVRQGERRTANRLSLKLQLMAKSISHVLQDKKRLFGNFRTDSIARNHREF